MMITERYQFEDSISLILDKTETGKKYTSVVKNIGTAFKEAQTSFNNDFLETVLKKD